jgi:predicted Zn-dependent protease
MPTPRLSLPLPPAPRRTSGLASAARTWRGLDRPVVIGDTETETLLRTYTNPLFRAAGLDTALVRSIYLRDAALNSFMTTGNRMFMNTTLPPGRRHGGKTATDENRKVF